MRNSIKTIITTVLLVLITTTASAMVKEQQAYLGGICQGMTIKEVQLALGKDYEKTKLDNNRYAYRYANGFYVETAGNIVTYFENDKDNGIETVDKLHVGSTMGQVEDALGEADHKAGNYHIYKASGEKDIVFIYNVDKKVADIHSGTSYEDEQNIKKEEENEKRSRNRIDVGDEIVIRTRQMREAYWNLRDVFNHGRHRW